MYPISIIFSDGELPPASKLTGISTQSRSAFNLIEKMLGDIWNQAGDAVLSPSGNITANATHIPNLARSIGRTSLLNQMIPAVGSTIALYDDDIGSNYSGMNHAYLKYKPNTSSFTLVNGGASITGLPVASPIDVNAAGKWFVDTSTGRLDTFSTIPSNFRIQYQPVITADVDSVQRWNIIPDPSTWSGNYQGVKISFANNTDNSAGYHIWLPPRKALTGSRLINDSPSSSNSNTTATPDSGSLVFFQSPSVNASLTNGTHYRYNIPTEIYSGLSAATTLPDGFLFIWDEQTGTILEGTTFYIPTNTAHAPFKLRVSGADLPNAFGTSIVGTPTSTQFITDDNTHLTTDYTSRFKLIVAGASVSQSLSRLWKLFLDHKHQVDDGTRPINHNSIDNLVTPAYSATFNSAYPSTVPAFPGSQWKHDGHSQYLHRAGSTGSSGTYRDPYDNALFNHLIVADPTFVAKLNLQVDSTSQASITPNTGVTLQLGCGIDSLNNSYIELNPSGHPNDIVFRHNLGTTTFENDIMLTSSTSNIYFNGSSSSGTLSTNILSHAITGGIGIFAFYRLGSIDTSRVQAGQYEADTYKYRTNSGLQLRTWRGELGLEIDASTGDMTAVTTINTAGARYRRNSSTTDVKLIIDANNIPDGASISSFQSRINGDTGKTVSVTFNYVPLDGSSSATTLGTCSTATNNTNGSLQSASLSSHTIDKNSNAYFIEVILPGSSPSNITRFYYAQLGFTIVTMKW